MGEWANGAWILVPMTNKMWDEAGIRLTRYDIVMLEQYADDLKKALVEIPRPHRKKPRLQRVCLEQRLIDQHEPSLPAASSSQSSTTAGQVDLDSLAEHS